MPPQHRSVQDCWLVIIVMKKKKILVGGGAGYICPAGSPMVKAGYGVEVIDLLWFGNHLPKGVKVSQRDLFDCTEADFGF